MANKKISQLTPKGSALAGTDLLEVSVFNGVTYDTKSLTGANVVSGLQPTLVSGTNIKTINSTSLLGSGNIVISTGLTVGTTPITSGTDTRLLFQNGGVVQQSANFTYDASLGLSVGNNTVGFVKTSTQNISGANVGELTTYSLNNFPLVKLTGGDLSTYFSGRIGLYYGNTEKAYLKASATGGEIGGFNSLLLKAQGALSTDIALRVRNSADSANLFSVQGDGKTVFGNSPSTYYMKSDGDFQFGGLFGYATQLGNIQYNVPLVYIGATNTSMLRTSGANNVRFNAASGGTTTGFLWNFAGTNLYLGDTNVAFNGNRTLSIENGTAPSASYTDAFQQYSADITAGNAAPHFRTENGSVVKLYQQTTAVTSATVVSGSGGNVKHDDKFDGYTVEQVVKALRNTGLLA